MQPQEDHSLAIAGDKKPVLLRPIANPAEMVEAHKALIVFVQEVLEEGRDYGNLPGTDKDRKNLLKPGAERLNIGFGLRAEFDVIEKEIVHNAEAPFVVAKWIEKPDPGRDAKEKIKATGQGRNKKFGTKWVWQEKEEERGISVGIYRYVVRCRLVTQDAREVGQGVGSCSSLEAKYIRQPRDTENTILKMAKKRAYVDATLTTLGLSDRFTQDVEDLEANKGNAPPEPAEEPIEAAFTEDAEPEFTYRNVIEKWKMSPEDWTSFRTLAVSYGQVASERLLEAYNHGLRDLQDACEWLTKSFGRGEAPKEAAAEVQSAQVAAQSEAAVPEVDRDVATPVQAAEGSLPPYLYGRDPADTSIPACAPTPFGFTPLSWPALKLFSDAASEAQGRTLVSRAQEKKIPDDKIKSLIALFRAEYQLPPGPDNTNSKGLLALVIGFLQSSDQAAIDSALAEIETPGVTA